MESKETYNSQPVSDFYRGYNEMRQTVESLRKRVSDVELVLRRALEGWTKEPRTRRATGARKEKERILELVNYDVSRAREVMAWLAEK